MSELQTELPTSVIYRVVDKQCSNGVHFCHLVRFFPAACCSQAAVNIKPFIACVIHCNAPGPVRCSNSSTVEIAIDMQLSSRSNTALSVTKFLGVVAIDQYMYRYFNFGLFLDFDA